jgi:peptide deformylase
MRNPVGWRNQVSREFSGKSTQNKTFCRFRQQQPIRLWYSILTRLTLNRDGIHMTTLDILHFPDPRLRNIAQPVANVDDAIRKLVDEMFETMYAAPGIGLAATQVNIDKRVIVIDISEEKDQPLCLINPEILARDGIEEMEEGCLSVPGVYELVERADHVKIRALDRDGNPFEMEAGDLLAVCIQHEIDHLDGKLFVDYLSPLKRARIRKKLEKEQRQSQGGPEKRPGSRAI